MIETLDALDKQAMIWLNGFHWSWLDPIMWIISGTSTWIPLYVVILVAIYKTQFQQHFNNWRQWAILLVSVVTAIVLADQIASSFFKPFVGRLRPSHQPELANLLHFLADENGSIYKGGLYGFVSSHASNSFAVALLASKLINRKWVTYTLFTWAALVSYSRIYLGVHFPGDIIGGAIVGILSAWIAVKLYFYLRKLTVT